MYCDKHDLKKDFVFCLEDECEDRLVCQKCHVMDRRHFGHSCVYIKYFMQNYQHEIVKVFNRMYCETLNNNQDIKQFQQIFDNKFNKFLDEREEIIRQSFEQMINNYLMSMQEFKAKLFQKCKINEISNIQQIQKNIQQLVEIGNGEQKQKETKQIVQYSKYILNIQNELDYILKSIEQNESYMVDNIQYVVHKYATKQNLLFKPNVKNNLDNIRQLDRYRDESSILINHHYHIIDCRNRIVYYQQQNDEQFVINVDFSTITDSQSKRYIIDMIDQLNANDKVGTLGIEISCNDNIDVNQIISISRKFNNLYNIFIYDFSDQIDSNIHNLLKLLVKERILLHFGIQFGQNLYDSDHSFNLLKDQNQIIMKYKGYLQYLEYSHSKIDKYTEQEENVRQLIDQVANI